MFGVKKISAENHGLAREQRISRNNVAGIFARKEVRARKARLPRKQRESDQQAFKSSRQIDRRTSFAMVSWSNRSHRRNCR